MELQTLYLETPPEHIAYIKFIFESYEEVGIIRTVDRKKALIVLLVVPDFVAVAQRILNSLKQEVPLIEIPRAVDFVTRSVSEIVEAAVRLMALV